MKRLTLLADINAYTGYGLHAIQIARDLERFGGCYVAVRAASKSEAFGATIPEDIRQRFVNGPQPEEWELLLHPPDLAPTPGKKTAYFTMSETSRLLPKAVQVLNGATVVIVPTSWNEQTFRLSGVTVPIRVVPLGIDPAVFECKPYPVGSSTIFGAAGRMAHGGVRKGLNEVMAAFKKAFMPCYAGVELHVKCYPDCPIDSVKDHRIKITAAHLSDKQLAAWYAGLTCFVSAARGEGWGLMQHQAMATGRPLISVSYGGVREFFKNDQAGWLLDYDLVPAKHAYAGQGDWAEAREGSLVTTLRMAARDRSVQIGRGFGARQAVRDFTWERSNRQLISVLQEFGAL